MLIHFFHSIVFFALLLTVRAQNVTCPKGEVYQPFPGGCFGCPLPSIYNPNTDTCALPCLLTFYTYGQINGLRITMVVLAWLNLCFITTVLLLYTLRVPKRWLSFPGNLMLTMLLVQLPYQVGFVLSTGHELRSWMCKDPYTPYLANSPRAGAQGGLVIFWSYAGVAHVLILALQLFLSVNGFLREVPSWVKQIIYYSFIFAVALSEILVLRIRAKDYAFTPNSSFTNNLHISGSYGVGTKVDLGITFTVPMSVMVGLTQILMILSMILIVKKSGAKGLFKQRRLLLFNGSYLFFITWIVIFLFYAYATYDQNITKAKKWGVCSLLGTPFNSPSCKPSSPVPFWFYFLSNFFYVLTSTAVSISYSWNAETRRLLQNLPVELGNTFGLSKGDSTIGPTSASNPSASKSKSEQAGKSVSHAEVSAKVEPEDW